MKLDVYDEFVVYRTRYTNDAADRLTKVVDALGNTTIITYDALGRKVGMNDPDMGIWSYAYNPLGQLISQTDALGQTQWFGYDGLGRMTEKRVGSASGALLASYLYDQGNNGIGRRSAMTDTTGYTAWYYDARGQVTMTQKLIAPNPAAYVTKFGYDDANRVITVSYPGGDVVTNSFDLAGQPYGLYAAASALVKSATYNALGAPTRVSFGNGLDKVNQYFGLDVPAGGAWGPLFAYGKLRNTCVITAGTACDTETPGALLNTVYWYDKAGNVTTVRDNVLNSKLTATYDALDRLVTARTAVYSSTWAETAPLSETYTYNAIGNLMGRYGVSTTGAITYPAAGSARPHAATGAGLNSYVYDLNGNMTVRREVSGTETYVYTQAWSIDNRLIGVTKALTSGAVLAQTSYFYDGDGVRVRKDDPDGTTLYAGPVEQTIGPGGTATAEYFDDISGTSTPTAYVATRNETVAAGLQQTFTVPPAGLGSEPYGVRYQIWLMVPTTDTPAFAGAGSSPGGVCRRRLHSERAGVVAEQCDHPRRDDDRGVDSIDADAWRDLQLRADVSQLHFGNDERAAGPVAQGRRGARGCAQRVHPRPRAARLLQLWRGGRGDEGRRDERGATHAELPARRPPRERFADDQRQRAEGERAALQALRRGALGERREHADRQAVHRPDPTR